jgi:hypothetical protein
LRCQVQGRIRSVEREDIEWVGGLVLTTVENRRNRKFNFILHD